MRRFFRKFRRQRPTNAPPPVLSVDIPGPRLSIDASRVIPMSQPSSPALGEMMATPAVAARRMTAPPAISAFYDGGNGGGSSSRGAMLRPPIPEAIQLKNDFQAKRQQQEEEEREEVVVEPEEVVEDEEKEEEKESKFLELPNELVLAVAELLPVSGISALLQCNRRFSILLELTLYRTAVKHSGYGKSMFCRCIQTGNTRSTLRMLELGADVNAIPRTGDGRTPLHYAVKSKNPDIVRAILEKPGVKVDVVDTSQTPSTPLSLAVSEGHEVIVKQLLDSNADARKSHVAKECYNAVKLGRLGIMRLLINHGLSVDHADITGNTFLHYAATFGNIEAVHMLLSCGANAAIANVNGVIPLYRAAEDNYLDVARLLLPKMHSTGACDVPTRYGATSLHAAVKKDYIDFARLLIRHGAGLDVQDNAGETPLHAAASRGQKDMVELLLKGGARVRIKNRNGIRPSGDAGAMGHTELERILEKAERDRALSGVESDDDGDSLSDSMVVNYHVYRNQDPLLRSPFP